MLTFAQGTSCFGVTSCQVFPPSRVRWISPSSVPAQRTAASLGEGASAYTTPRCSGRAGSVPRYLPTFAGASHILRVRSGLICCQLRPPSRVFQTVFEAKKSVRGSVGEKTMGWVRMTRYPALRSGTGEMSWTCRVRRSQRVILPP